MLEFRASTGVGKIEPGIYHARCVGLYDVGVVTDTFSGEEKTRQKVILDWQLQNGLSVQREYTVSVHKRSALGMAIEKWMYGGQWNEPRSPVISVVLGEYCDLKIGANAKGYPKVEEVLQFSGDKEFETSRGICIKVGDKWEGDIESVAGWVKRKLEEAEQTEASEAMEEAEVPWS